MNRHNTPICHSVSVARVIPFQRKKKSYSEKGSKCSNENDLGTQCKQAHTNVHPTEVVHQIDNIDDVSQGTDGSLFLHRTNELTSTKGLYSILSEIESVRSKCPVAGVYLCVMMMMSVVLRVLEVGWNRRRTGGGSVRAPPNLHIKVDVVLNKVLT